MDSILWRPGIQQTIDKDADDVRRWLLRRWVEGATLASAVVSVATVSGPDPAPDPAFVAVWEGSVGADYVDVRITPNGVPAGGVYAVTVAPRIETPGVRVDNFTVQFVVVDQ